MYWELNPEYRKNLSNQIKIGHALFHNITMCNCRSVGETLWTFVYFFGQRCTFLAWVYNLYECKMGIRMHPLDGILDTVQRECTELFCGQMNTAEQHSPPGCYVRMY